MKILITGATGSLGLPLCLHFKNQGHSVVGIGRQPARLNYLSENGIQAISMDLETASSEQLNSLLNNCDWVIHSAALTRPWGPIHEFTTPNVLASEKLFELALQKKIKKFVHISTTAVYYDGTSKTDLTEKSPLPRQQAISYSATKLSSENVALRFNSLGLPLIILRPRAIVSLYDQTLVPRIIPLMKMGFFPLMDGGKSVVDVTPAESICHAAELALQADEKYNGEIYNVTNDEPIEIHTLLKNLSAAFNLNPRWIPVNSKSVKNLAPLFEKVWPLFSKAEPPLCGYSIDLISSSQTFDISKIKSDLGYRPVITNSDAIANLKNWRNFI